MPTGFVKFFNDRRGFGFIVDPDEGDVFVLRSTVEMAGLPTLASGQHVRFDLKSNRKTGKPEAVNIKLIQEHPA